MASGAKKRAIIIAALAGVLAAAIAAALAVSRGHKIQKADAAARECFEKDSRAIDKFASKLDAVFDEYEGNVKGVVESAPKLKTIYRVARYGKDAAKRQLAKHFEKIFETSSSTKIDFAAAADTLHYELERDFNEALQICADFPSQKPDNARLMREFASSCAKHMSALEQSAIIAPTVGLAADITLSAGAGAAAGSLIPIPGVGTAIGVAVGFAGGYAAEAYVEKSSDAKIEKEIVEALGAMREKTKSELKKKLLSDARERAELLKKLMTEEM
ncbi:MAG: hypothetical protein IJI37_01220 [Opitutales bacterium]|nr:hypothetical protein [Opitutales bacterium]